MGLKGILLAGGKGTRLDPMTRSVNKHLLAVYDKPLVYYPLSTLMLSGIREVLLITTSWSLRNFKALLGDGSQWGLSLLYAVQEEPLGIPQAILIGEEFIDGGRVCLILGDNIFYAEGLSQKLQRVAGREEGATIFGYRVQDPGRYCVVTYDENGRPDGLEEKPELPHSNVVATGLYYYDRQAVDLARQLSPSKRGELEISDLNRMYLRRRQLAVEILEGDAAWMDAGTHDSMLEAANLVRAIERRRGSKIACPEEIAFQMGFISEADARHLAESLADNACGRYMRRALEAD